MNKLFALADLRMTEAETLFAWALRSYQAGDIRTADRYLRAANRHRMIGRELWAKSMALADRCR